MKNLQSLKQIGFVRHEILTGIENYLVLNFENSRQLIIDHMALKQKIDTKGKAGFRYKGEAYIHQSEQALPFQLARLPTNLVDEFEDHLAAWELHKERQLVSRATIISALSIMSGIKDLYTLLPDCLYPALPLEPTGETSLCSDSIKSFIDTNKEGLEFIKFQFVMKTIKG